MPPVFGCYVNDNEPGSDAEYGASINIVSGGDGYSPAVGIGTLDVAHLAKALKESGSH